VEFSGVPKGTTGKAYGQTKRSTGTAITQVEWDLPYWHKPLVDWFSRDEYCRFLAEGRSQHLLCRGDESQKVDSFGQFLMAKEGNQGDSSPVVDLHHASSYATFMTPQQYLQNYLKSKDITQAEFGKSLGIRQEMVNQWLTGRRPISPEKAVLIEELYGLEAEILCPRLRRLRKTVKA
jgi:hypothetical protein